MKPNQNVWILTVLDEKSRIWSKSTDFIKIHRFSSLNSQFIQKPQFS